MLLKECDRPCQIQNYKFSPLITNDILDTDPDSYFYIALISNQTIVKEHLRVFDTNAIIGTIGGALGLFIGFSFLHCIKDISDFGSKLLFKASPQMIPTIIKEAEKTGVGNNRDSSVGHRGQNILHE